MAAQEFGRRPPPRFLEEELEAGRRHQVAEREVEAVMQCAECHLWFSGLHVGASGRYLCRMCIELAGENRPSPWVEWTGSRTVRHG